MQRPGAQNGKKENAIFRLLKNEKKNKALKILLKANWSVVKVPL